MSGRGYGFRIALATRSILVEKFPACFVPDKAPKRPLKIGIVSDIRERLPEMAGSRISRALYTYTDGPTYLDFVIEGADRIDLDGNPAGKVTAREAVDAARRSVGVREARRQDAEIKRLQNLLRRIEDEWSDGQYISSALISEVQIELGLVDGDQSTTSAKRAP